MGSWHTIIKHFKRKTKNLVSNFYHEAITDIPRASPSSRGKFSCFNSPYHESRSGLSVCHALPVSGESCLTSRKMATQFILGTCKLHFPSYK